MTWNKFIKRTYPARSGLIPFIGVKGVNALKISSREVEYVAHLARLEITDSEKEKFTAQLNDILLYIDKLNELDTKGVEPMSHAIAVTNAFREDKILDSIGTENSLANAPDARGEFFRVPKVIDWRRRNSSLQNIVGTAPRAVQNAAWSEITPYNGN